MAEVREIGASIENTQRPKWIAKYLDCTVLAVSTDKTKGKIYCVLADETGAMPLQCDTRDDVEIIVNEGITLYDFGVRPGKLLSSAKTIIATGNDPIQVPDFIRERAPPLPGSEVSLSAALNSPSKDLMIKGKVMKVGVASPQKVKRGTIHERDVVKQRVLLKDDDSTAIVCLWGTLTDMVSVGDVIGMNHVNPYTYKEQPILSTTEETTLEVINDSHYQSLSMTDSDTEQYILDDEGLSSFRQYTIKAVVKADTYNSCPKHTGTKLTDGHCRKCNKTYGDPHHQYAVATLLCIDVEKKQIIKATFFLPMLQRLLESYGVSLITDGELLPTTHLRKGIISIIKDFKGAPFKALIQGDTINDLRVKRKEMTPQP